MRVLVAYERSGQVRRAFRALGHEAWSVDLQPSSDGSPHHEQANVWEIVGYPHWDLIIAHPPCTYLSVSGLHWNDRKPERRAWTESALEEFGRLLDLPNIRRREHPEASPLMLCVENPVGIVSTRLRKATQYVQPYQFGDDASKRTGLWLVNLPKLIVPHEEHWIAPRIVNGKPRWANQTDSGQNRLGPSPDRADKRAETYPGIARAMAEQWGRIPTE